MKEEQLFRRFKTLTSEIMDTAAVVQNDYEWLTDNQAITLDQIKEDYWRFLKRVEDHKKELDSLSYDTQMRLSEIMQELAS